MKKLLVTLMTSAIMISGIGVVALQTSHNADAMAVAKLGSTSMSVGRPVSNNPGEFTPMVDPRAPMVASGPVRTELENIVWDSPFQSA